jgi:outer membrane protein OmpA-like peptidoglycan-associated protein
MSVRYAQSGARSTQKDDVTPAEAKAAEAKDKAEAARQAAEQAEKDAVSAQEKAAIEVQKATAERVKDLERELAEFKAQETERGLVLILGDVQFAPNQEKLTAETMRKLYPFVTMLKEQPKRPICVEGHTDSSGEKSYNLDLSQRRADAVRDFLMENGIGAERITPPGATARKGLSRPMTRPQDARKTVGWKLLSPGQARGSPINTRETDVEEMGTALPWPDE